MSASDNGKWYCWRAQNSANNWGYGNYQVPQDFITDNTSSPVITVRPHNSADDNPQLRVSASESVTRWQYRGPLSSSTCEENTFESASPGGSTYRVTLSASDNGKWYCWRAQNSANNWGYGNYQVPQDFITDNTSSPVITVRPHNSADDNPQLRVSASESVTRWQFKGPLSSSTCEENTFESASPGGSTYRVTLSASDNGKWYCWRAQNSANNWGYGNYQVPQDFITDNTSSPVITVRPHNSADDNPQLRVSASESVTRWQFKGPLSSSTCEENTFESASPGGSTYRVTLSASDNGKWYCWRAQNSANNWGYGNYQVPQDFITDNTSSPVITVDYLTTGGNPQLSASANESVTSWQFKGPLSSSNCSERTFTGASPGGSGSFHFVTLTDSASAGKWYCFRAKDSANNWGYGSGQMPVLPDPPIVDEETDIVSPVITVSPSAGSVDENPQLSASANENVTNWRYIGPLSSSNCSESTFLWKDWNSAFHNGSRVTLIDSASAGKWYCFRAKDSANNWGYGSGQMPVPQNPIRYTPPVITVAPLAGFRSRVGLQASANKNLTNWQYRGPLSSSTCEESTFAGENIPSRNGSRVTLIDSASASKWYCFRAKDSANNWGYGSGQMPDDTTQTLATTERLTTGTFLRGEDRVLSAQPQLEVADIIVNDTWESVALLEDADCDEAAFDGAEEINEGSEVSNPVLDTQYCFRVQDENGGTNYINAFVTEASFSGIASTTSKQSGVGLVETEENSKLMLVVTIAGGVVLLAVVVSIFIFISGQSNRPKFR